MSISDNNKETLKWLRMAKDDLDTAQVIIKEKKYYVAAFFSQQSVEKALKSLLLYKEKRIIKVHDLTFLGRRVGLEKNLLDKCAKLNPIYIETRYGSIDEVIPSEKFKKTEAEEYIKIAEEILKWVEKNI